MRFRAIALLFAALGTGLPAACHADATPSPGHAARTWKHGLPSSPAYFPIAVWLQEPALAPKYKAAGINLYIGLWQGPTEAQLAALKAAGMPVICEMNAVAKSHLDDPTIVGWMHGDEPDNAQSDGHGGYGPCVPPQRIVNAYHSLQALDPTRPVMLNLGQGVANDDWVGRGSGAKQEDYLTYVKGGDIVSFDVYPVAGLGEGGQDKIWYVAKGIERLAKWSEGKRRIWNCIECTSISDAHKPTPTQMRSEVWMSIIHGSTGLIYFVHAWHPGFNEHALLDDPAMLAEVTATNRQIQALAPVINSPTITTGVRVTSDADTPVDLLAKRHGGATYLFAVGMRNRDARATFTVDSLPAGTRVEVLGENRYIAADGKRFSDHFGPYAVHIYRITP